jgi:hypothetical protein
VIKTLDSGRSHPSLRDGVGPGRSERGADRCDAQVADPAMDASHVLRDGPRGDSEAQSCQLRLDTFLSPQEVLGRHATNEKLQVRRNGFSSRSSSASRTPAPIGFPPLSVPSQDRSRYHDRKRLSPVRAPPGCQDQKLPTEARIFSHQRRLRPEECRDGPNYPASQTTLPLLLLSAEAFHGDSLTESGAD